MCLSGVLVISCFFDMKGKEMYQLVDYRGTFGHELYCQSVS